MPFRETGLISHDLIIYSGKSSIPLLGRFVGRLAFWPVTFCGDAKHRVSTFFVEDFPQRKIEVFGNWLIKLIALGGSPTGLLGSNFFRRKDLTGFIHK